MGSVLALAVVVLALLLAIAVAYAVVTGWRSIAHDPGPLPLFGMLDRRPLAEGSDALSAGRLALATRRCAFCDRKPECRVWLASPKSRDCPPYCPNASLF